MVGTSRNAKGLGPAEIQNGWNLPKPKWLGFPKIQNDWDSPEHKMGVTTRNPAWLGPPESHNPQWLGPPETQHGCGPSKTKWFGRRRTQFGVWDLLCVLEA